jgi:type III pantothenate kinase
VTTLLVIDIGNTNVSLGLFDYEQKPGSAEPESRLSDHWRVGTHREQTSDEMGLTLTSLFAQSQRELSEVSDVVISSVVPPLLPIFERVSTKLFATRTRGRSGPTGSSTPWPPTSSSAAR